MAGVKKPTGYTLLVSALSTDGDQDEDKDADENEITDADFDDEVVV